MNISINSAGLYLNYDAEKAYKMFSDAGFDAIDWNINIKTGWEWQKIVAGNFDIHSIFDSGVEEMIDFFKPQLDAMKKNNLKINQAHAPFPAYVSGHPEFVDYSIERLKKCIIMCDKLGIKFLIIHGISRELNDKTMDAKYLFDLNCHLYESLIPTLKETKVIVCLENLFAANKKGLYQGFCSDPNEAVSYVDRFNSIAGKECFGFCFDTGHNNITGRSASEFILTLGSRLKALHVHDNWGNDDSHLLPFTGNIIWKDFTDALKKVGFDGDMSFEVQNQISLKMGIEEDAVPVLLKAVQGIGEVFVKRICQ